MKLVFFDSTIIHVLVFVSKYTPYLFSTGMNEIVTYLLSFLSPLPSLSFSPSKTHSTASL